jgi:hypothetical protein
VFGQLLWSTTLFQICIGHSMCGAIAQTFRRLLSKAFSITECNIYSNEEHRMQTSRSVPIAAASTSGPKENCENYNEQLIPVSAEGRRLTQEHWRRSMDDDRSDDVLKCSQIELLPYPMNRPREVDSKGFWRWCITLRITAFLDFFHRPVFQNLPDDERSPKTQ